MRIPIRESVVSIWQQTSHGNELGRGNETKWKAVDVFTPEQLEEVIRQHKDTQGAGWENIVRTHCPWNPANVRS